MMFSGYPDEHESDKNPGKMYQSMEELPKMCENCIYVDDKGLSKKRECSLLEKIVEYEYYCDDYVSLLVIARDIVELMDTDPLLRIDAVAEKISQKHERLFPPRLVRHLMMSSTSHSLTYAAWNTYKKNKRAFKKEQKKQEMKKRREEIRQKRIELGAIPDPNGLPPAEEADYILESPIFSDLCELIGVDIEDTETVKDEVMKHYKKKDEKE